MGIKDKINFRQPKYMLPAIIYFPLLFFGYFFFRFFNTEKAEVNNKMQTTEYYNDKLPDANLKGDGIGDKYSNMVNNFGKIKDESAVENIERGNEDQKEEYNSQYSDAEVAAMDQQSDEAQQSMERLRRLQAQIKEQQAKDENVTGSRISGNIEDEEQTLENLRKALEEAQNEGKSHVGTTEGSSEEYHNLSAQKVKKNDNEDKKVVNEHSVSEISEDAKAEEVVKKQKETSDYFNTIVSNEPEHKLIRAIVDEDNPAVSMSTEDMARYARKIWSSPARYRNVSTKQHRMTMRLNNIYSVGDYFFLDFSVENRTNIRFDIDQLRVKLNDKKTAKATTVQTIELTPDFMLDNTQSFLYGYRNVLVVKKMTFPNDKILTIELSEQQISGRTISLSVEYEDVLNADSFNKALLYEY